MSTEEKQIHPVDVYVGQRLRQRRWIANVTQQQLAESVGIKFQQIQKYETGANRVSASRLWDISVALQVPVSYFFEGVTNATAVDGNSGFETEGILNKETAVLVRNYRQIPENRRKKLLDIARTLREEE